MGRQHDHAALKEAHMIHLAVDRLDANRNLPASPVQYSMQSRLAVDRLEDAPTVC